jgi:methylmalonyl-CoA mutase cobalamin-binding domain/chain
MNQIMPKIVSMLDEVGGRKVLGKILIGTVKGDIHDIGKNLMSVLLKAAGFDVVDLGIDISPERFVEAIKEQNPMIVGLSGLLTLSIDPMKETVDAIKEAGFRDQVKIIIGGNPVTANIHDFVGSDQWTNNAAEGVSRCQKWAEV